ncbi:DUF4158 domain-containing protein [Nonomuraea sp. NPDC002799]
MGRFPRLAEIPAQVIEHVRNELGLPERIGMTDVAERTGRNHKALVRARLGLDGDQAAARKLAEQAIRQAAKTKDHPADLINVALEELAKNSCEFPAFSTLDDLAAQVRTEVNGAIFTLAYGRMGFDDHARMLAMLEVDPATGRSGHDRAKKSAPRATVTKLRQQLDHLAWLDGMAGGSDAWLKGVPASKIAHFAAEARALDAAEIRDYGEVKRIVMEACLLHQARIRARDDLVTMLCKRMNTMHNKARELLETIRAEQRQRNERMLAVLGDLLSAAKEVDLAARNAPNPWTAVRRRHETGRAVWRRSRAMAAWPTWWPSTKRWPPSTATTICRCWTASISPIVGCCCAWPACWCWSRPARTAGFWRRWSSCAPMPPAPASSSAMSTRSRKTSSMRRPARCPR